MNKESKKILIFVSVLLVVIVIAGYFIRKNKLDAFRSNGIEVTAGVADVQKSRDVIRMNRRRYEYFAEVTFFTIAEDQGEGEKKKALTKDEDGKYKFNLKPSKSGDFIMTKIGITASQYGKLKKGQKVQILYLKDDPKKAILKEELE